MSVLSRLGDQMDQLYKMAAKTPEHAQWLSMSGWMTANVMPKLSIGIIYAILKSWLYLKKKKNLLEPISYFKWCSILLFIRKVFSLVDL